MGCNHGYFLLQLQWQLVRRTSTVTAKKITKLCVRQGFVIAFVPRLVDPFIHLFSGGNVENEFEEIVKASEIIKIRIFVVFQRQY